MKTSIRFVLVGTSHPGNIGAVARAMKTMGLRSLYLVSPVIFPSSEATARASGADDILAQAQVCETLAEALQGCELVVGASARVRKLAVPEMDPRQCAQHVVHEASHRSVAIVFGREHSGLTNHELGQCHFQVEIPADADFSSLNLAAAAQVIAYEIMMVARAGKEADQKQNAVENVVDGDGRQDLATAEEMELYYQHLEQVMIEIDFLDPECPKRLMHRLRRLYNRARPDKNEINILRGILTAVQAGRVRR